MFEKFKNMNVKNLIQGKFDYKNRILWYLLVVVFAPIMILGLFSYHTYVTEVTRNVNLSTKATANQIKNRTDSVLINIKKSYLEVEETEEIKWLLNTFLSYSDYSELVKAIDELDGSTYLSEYIDGFTFINFNTGWVLSNRGLYEYEAVKNKEDIEMLHQYEANTLVRNFWLNRIGINHALKMKRETVNLNNLSFICKLPAKSKEPYALMIINLNQSKLQKMIGDNLGNNDITVLDSNDNLIYTSNSDIFTYCQANNDLLSNEKVQTIKLENGQIYNVAVADSDEMGWRYIVSYDTNNIKAAADKILSFSIVMIAIVILGFGMAILATRRIYEPVSDLTEHIHGLGNENRVKKKENEFEFIAKSIDNLVGKNNALEKLMESQRGQLTEFFQLRLVRNEIKQQLLGQYLTRLKLKPKKYIGVISINIRSQDEEYDETKQDAVRLSVIETMPEEILKQLFMSPICSARVMVMSMTGDNKEELEANIIHVFDLFSKYVQQQYLLHISFGISKIFEDLFLYQTAYHESLEALKNSEVFYVEQEDIDNQNEYEETSAIMFYSDIMNNADRYVYNTAFEGEIKESVDSCDRERAFRTVDKFVEELSSKKVTSNECSFYMHRFLISIVLIASNAGLVINDIFGHEANNIFLSFNQIYDLDKMSSFFKYKVVTPIISELSKFRTSRTTEIMESIQTLVEETKGDITLAECAERLGYHPSYIWKIMKSEKNITFSDYIAEYRILEAKRMLTGTQLTVADIAATLNYTNTQNFIRFFSKHVGTTPGKFRQDYNKVLD
jgi:AraC-like DNA-binding protein